MKEYSLKRLGQGGSYMSGKKGMKWDKKEKFPYSVNSALTEKQAEKLMKFCGERKWNISQAVRNIIFWYFEKEAKKQSKIDAMCEALLKEDSNGKN